MLDYGNATRTALPKNLPWLYHFTAQLYTNAPQMFNPGAREKETTKNGFQDLWYTKAILRFPPHWF
jgi:hypothetical protein